MENITFWKKSKINILELLIWLARVNQCRIKYCFQRIMFPNPCDNYSLCLKLDVKEDRMIVMFMKAEDEQFMSQQIWYLKSSSVKKSCIFFFLIIISLEMEQTSVFIVKRLHSFRKNNIIIILKTKVFYEMNFIYWGNLLSWMNEMSASKSVHWYNSVLVHNYRVLGHDS